MDFARVGIRRIFHAADHLGLEELSLLYQFFHAFRSGFGKIRQTLRVSGLPGGTGTGPFFLGRNRPVGRFCIIGFLVIYSCCTWLANIRT